MSKTKKKYLQKNKSCVYFHPKIAADLKNLEEAAFLHNICFWVCQNRKNESEKHLENGHYWTYGSARHFCELLPFLTPSKVRRIRKNLIEKGYIETGCFNRWPQDKTTWYTYTPKVMEVTGERYIKTILGSEMQVNNEESSRSEETLGGGEQAGPVSF